MDTRFTLACLCRFCSIRTTPVSQGELSGRSHVARGDLVLVELSGAVHQQYVSCLRAFYIQPVPYYGDVAPSVLHEAFDIAGGVFTEVEVNVDYDIGERMTWTKSQLAAVSHG